MLFAAPAIMLNTHNHENWALLLAALSAGAFYALVAALIELQRASASSRPWRSRFTFVMVPPLALIFLVLGTIFIGVATPTEGGAMGATGALVLAMMKRRLTFDLTRQAAESTAKLSAFVVFILIGARVFSLTFYGVDGHRWVEELLVSLPGGPGRLPGLRQRRSCFVLAFFLDFFEIAFIVIPLLGRPAERLGIDLIWFGVMLGVNMQTSFMHPPFGFALFYLRSVAPKEPYIDRVTRKLHGAGHHRPDLLGRGAVRGDPVHHGRARHRVSRHGDALQGHRADRSTPRRSRSRSRRSSCRRRSISASRRRSNRKPRSDSSGAMLVTSQACSGARAQRASWKLSNASSATWNQA